MLVVVLCRPGDVGYRIERRVRASGARTSSVRKGCRSAGGKHGYGERVDGVRRVHQQRNGRRKLGAAARVRLLRRALPQAVPLYTSPSQRE